MSLKSELQDSQDWLGEVVDELLTEDETYIGKTLYMEQHTLPAIREHFLKEALEMIDSTPKLILKGKFEDDMGLFGDYIEVAELRNKFNDKYKEY